MRSTPVLAILLATLAAGCFGGTIPGGIREPPHPELFAFTFDVRVTQAFAARTSPLSFPDNGSCVSINSDDTQVWRGHARASWTPNTPATQTLALGVIPPYNVSQHRAVNGTSPLELDLDPIHVTKDNPFFVYVGVASGTGVAVQQDARLALEMTYSGLAPTVLNATCKIAIGN